MVTTGFTRLTDGAEVRATPAEPVAADDAPASPAAPPAAPPAAQASAAPPPRGPDRPPGGWEGRSREGAATPAPAGPRKRAAMSVSAPFILRPIATSLLGVAVLLAGLLGYLRLSVSSLPQVDFPTIQVTTQLPGANPDTVASLVTASLERQFGQIPALAGMASQSSFGLSQITLQFELDRDIDAAAQDVQAAINAAASTLPRNLPYPPTYAKVNPADTPIITLALTSRTPIRCAR